MTRKALKTKLQARMEELKKQRADQLAKANDLDQKGNYADADIHFCNANACLARISEISMIINDL